MKKNEYQQLTEEEKRIYLTLPPEEREKMLKRKGREAGRPESAPDDYGGQIPNKAVERKGGGEPAQPKGNVRRGPAKPEPGPFPGGDNDIFLEYVVDGTYSFSTVFPAVYRAIKVSVEKMQKACKTYQGIRIKYGLTVIHDNIHTVRFDGKPFTEDGNRFLGGLEDIKFSGGSADGKEKINEAVEAGIRVLENESHPLAGRGLLLFTDSMPEETYHDFRKIDGCPNRGLRFAVCFLKSSAYQADFHLVDRYGNIATNNKNAVADFYGLERLFRQEGLRRMEEVVNEFMGKMSVCI